MIRAALAERAEIMHYPAGAIARRARGPDGFAWIFLEWRGLWHGEQGTRNGIGAAGYAVQYQPGAYFIGNRDVTLAAVWEYSYPPEPEPLIW